MAHGTYDHRVLGRVEAFQLSIGGPTPTPDWACRAMREGRLLVLSHGRMQFRADGLFYVAHPGDWIVNSPTRGLLMAGAKLFAETATRLTDESEAPSTAASLEDITIEPQKTEYVTTAEMARGAGAYLGKVGEEIPADHHARAVRLGGMLDDIAAALGERALQADYGTDALTMVPREALPDLVKQLVCERDWLVCERDCLVEKVRHEREELDALRAAQRQAPFLRQRLFYREKRDRALLWAARRMPKRLRFWATVVAGAEATTGKWSKEEVPALHFMDVLKRVEVKP